MEPGVFFGTKPFCRLSEALEAAADIAENAEDDVDVVIIPPDPSSDTDEEEGDEDCTASAPVNDVSGTLEVHWRANEEEADKRVPPVKRAKVAAVNWSRKEPEYTWGNSTDGAVVRKAELRALYEGYSPSQIFSTIFDDHILTHIIVQTGHYAKQKNEHGFSFSLDDLKRFIGILLLSGYHSLPRQKLYWCVDEDVGVPYVAKCMSRNRFYEIKGFLHLADNDLIKGSTDRMYKGRPLMNLLNGRFQQHGIFHRNLSVDESMVKYFGHHPCKQFMRGKPIRFGYKNWMMCSDDGFCYAFDT
ncbi:piggyBac transposable element-derived protein 2-like [Ixodes scapularis]|uniref:piggyBac transposable element-derived protein 2-like n=1 Tax=Ixodes scapularis TaxID=6945 RepID=UPI001C394606|nr:piggyBac transposable element-derived protein 2-like [Ixodes scapularis]